LFCSLCSNNTVYFKCANCYTLLLTLCARFNVSCSSKYYYNNNDAFYVHLTVKYKTALYACNIIMHYYVAAVRHRTYNTRPYMRNIIIQSLGVPQLNPVSEVFIIVPWYCAEEKIIGTYVYAYVFNLSCFIVNIRLYLLVLKSLNNIYF